MAGYWAVDAYGGRVDGYWAVDGYRGLVVAGYGAAWPAVGPWPAIGPWPASGANIYTLQTCDKTLLTTAKTGVNCEC